MAQQIEHLVKMANQIALNVGAQDDVDALAEKTAKHIQRFWTRDMQAQLRDHWQAGGEDLAPAVRRMLEMQA